MIRLPWEPALPLYTERLILRVHEHGDLDDMLAFHSDPVVVRYLPWPIRTRAQVAEALIPKLRAGRVDSEGDWLVLAIEETDSALVIGEVLRGQPLRRRVDVAPDAGPERLYRGVG